MKPLSAALGPWLAAAAVVLLALAGADGRAGAAVAPAASETRLAQADTTGAPVFEDDEDAPEDEEEVPIPPNLQTPDSPDAKGGVPADTSGAAAARSDSMGGALPANPTLPDTLHPGFLPPASQVKPGGAATPPPAAPKPKGSIFGLTPVVILLGLAAIHVLVIRAVGD